MSARSTVQPGIRPLITKHAAWLRNRRVALLSHPSAIDNSGTASAELLYRHCGAKLVSLLGAEHGYFGQFGAGASVRSRRHPDWGIPIHSLYGKTAKPTAAMLADVDVLIVDLQDLAVRCYTYVSTLRYVLEAAAERGLGVIVADRPVPFQNTVEGPVTSPGFESMVAHVHLPMIYGMTPAESAGWISEHYQYDLDLKLCRVAAYRRRDEQPRYTPTWIPPSPAITSWETAWCYPMTVFSEAIPAIDCGRGTRLPFQVFGASWMKGPAVAVRLNEMNLPGLRFHSHIYTAAISPYKDQLLSGVRIAVTESARIRPVKTSLSILACLQEQYGKRRVWSKSSRPDFFDKLYGTDEVRIALQDGASAEDIAETWKPGISRFRRSRKRHLLYE